MKNIYDALRSKETELARLQQEIEILRSAAKLLTDDTDAKPDAPKVSHGPISLTQLQMICGVLTDKGQPMRLDNIVVAIEQKYRQKIKSNNLSSLIYRNLKSKNKLLRKEAAPNTFGLIEWPAVIKRHELNINSLPLISVSNESEGHRES